jgi:rhodanese-related sulfurtransferase
MNIQVLAVAVVAVGGVLLARRFLLGGRYQTIGPVEVKRLLDEGGALLLDVRTAGEFAAGKIKGARLIPLAELSRRVQELPPAATVVVYCAVGGRSRVAAKVLGQRDGSTIYNLAGGLVAWQKAGYPISR